jgi:diguanylate cyclase (GGDEF)-like protein/PAS domain S-box-containing protein
MDASMESHVQYEIQTILGNFRPEETSIHRRRSIHVLFIHRDADVIDDCLQELNRGQFTVTADFLLNLGQCTEQCLSKNHDLIVIEYPSPSCQNASSLKQFCEYVRGIPVILLTAANQPDTFSELTAQNIFENVARENAAHLPMAVRRVLREKNLRDELVGAQKALQHSRALYRALVDNPAYGIYHCSADGKVLDLNQALVTMLGYTSKEQFLAANQESSIIADVRNGSPFAARSFETGQTDPVEVEWKRKDGTTLKARLSGRGVFDENDNYAGNEIIAVDVTDQRTLQDQLRLQASSDSLTGLANYRRLFEVLHAEICRSQRTGREFSLLLLDLDGLKRVNDQFGHLTGDRALGRLGQILRDCCRSIDTAARHGGDEFAVVLPETGQVAATLVARRICELLENDAEQPALTVSLGMASYPREAATIGTLLYAADKALYAMKSLKPTIPRSFEPSFAVQPESDLNSFQVRKKENAT